MAGYTVTHTTVMGSKAMWEKWLPLAFAYNSTPSSSTSYSPFFLLYRFEPHSPANYVHGDSRSIGQPLTNQSAQEFIQELEVHCALARDSLAHALSRQAQAYNQKRCPEYKVSDKVLMNPHSLCLVDIRVSGHKLLQ